MKKLLIFIAPLLLLFAAGCEPKVKAEVKIIVNHEAEACGVKDPTENIVWVYKLHTWHSDQLYLSADSKNEHSYNVFFYAFENDTSDVNTLVVETQYDGHFYSMYDCDGELIFLGSFDGANKPDKNSVDILKNDAPQSPPYAPYCVECEKFFKHNTLVDTVSQYSYIVY